MVIFGQVSEVSCESFEGRLEDLSRTVHLTLQALVNQTLVPGRQTNPPPAQLLQCIATFPEVIALEAARKTFVSRALNGGVSNGGVSRSGLVLPFLSLFVLFGTFPICSGIFPVCSGMVPGDFPDLSFSSFSAY